MRAIIIDPVKQEIREADIDTSYEAFRKLVSVSGWVERIRLPQHWLWVDEEGLLQPEPQPFFRIPRFHPETTFCGTGVILGEDTTDGEHGAADVELALVRANVTFPRVRFTGFHDSESVQNHPVFGSVATITRKAIFEDLP